MTRIVKAEAHLKANTGFTKDVPQSVENNGTILAFENNVLDRVIKGDNVIFAKDLCDVLAKAGLVIVNAQSMLDQILATKEVIDNGSKE